MASQGAAAPSVLRARANIISNIRDFFSQRQVLEVDVPLLGAHSVSDPFLDALSCEINNRTYYLQTSPEYFMKRLLAAGTGDIYYLGKAFRADENGPIHHHEFTMLEWYRQAWDERALAREVVALVQYLQPSVSARYCSYQALFEAHVGVNPHTASANELERIARVKLNVHFNDDERTTWLDLLFTHIVEPELGANLVVVYDYPEDQAALAKIGLNQDQQRVAKRFEVFFKGVELANGYCELTDALEQSKRFEHDNQRRASLGKPLVEIDPAFMAALESGLPESAGVALGLDRLIMCLLSLTDIGEQMSIRA